MNTLIDPTKLSVRGPEFCQPASVLDTAPIPAAKHAAAPSQTAFLSAGDAALASLRLAVNEAYVFAAVIGREESRTSVILAELLAGSRARRICVEIRAPQQVSAKDTNDIDNAIRQYVERHGEQAAQVLVAVHSAHAATDVLLSLLDRLAGDRNMRGATQVVLAGLPALWRRLNFPAYEKLEQRLAVRCVI